VQIGVWIDKDKRKKTLDLYCSSYSIEREKEDTVA
jgi:hypothetical protein